MNNTENELIAASMLIGNIADTPAWYTAGLAERIEATGKHVNQLTIGELLEIEQQHHEATYPVRPWQNAKDKKQAHDTEEAA